MSKITYINTQEIRRDLHGFLKNLETGREYVVLNRSKPLARINQKGLDRQPRTDVRKMLAIADKIRAQAKPVLDPSKSVKELYRETMAKKYGIR